jgi:hypothetical protein
METHSDRGGEGSLRIGWPAGTVGGLLVVGLGLELLAHQTFGRTDVATLLLAVYLAAWLSVLGIVGFVILAITWCVSARRSLSNHTGDLHEHVVDLHAKECSRPA